MHTDQYWHGFMTGVNYWGSEKAIKMWDPFKPEIVERDFQQLQKMGVTHLRVFPLWPVFQPLNALYGPEDVYEYTLGEDPLPDTPAGRAGVSEEACQNFHIFCDLAEKYHLKLLVGLITGHMSFRTYAPPAFLGKQLLTDPTVIKWQVRFVKYFVQRFKGESCIMGWDLGNEVSNMPGMKNQPADAFYVWCCLIADAIRCCDPSRPVISGLDHSSIEKGFSNLKSISEICDMHTTHPYNIFSTASDPLNTMKPILNLPFRCKISEDVSGLPTFVQEFGAIGYMNCSRKTEADFYRAALWTSLTHDCHGVMWWCAFDQGHLDDAPYRWNNIGSDYGFLDKDGKEKPVAEENRRFRQLLSLLPQGKLPPHRVDATILIPREEKENQDQKMLQAAYMLAKQANLDVNFCYCLDPIPDSRLYILPSVRDHKSIPKNRLDALLEKVRRGAVLYLCADTGLMRQLPDITGVDIACREEVNTQKQLHFAGVQLPINAHYCYWIENSRAQIIGTDEKGQGAFFRYDYGKGQIYFLTLPLERYLSEKQGAFFLEDQPPYHLIYRELARAAGIDRVCDCDHPYIRLTEHPIDENSLYVAAVNYSSRPGEAHFSIRKGYRATCIYGPALYKNGLSLKENDGALLFLEKEK